MSKAITTLKPNVVSSISKATTPAWADCINISPAQWRGKEQRRCYRPRARATTALHLQDAFVGLLLSAGQCHRQSHSWRRRDEQKRAQTQSAVSHAAAREDETTTTAYTDGPGRFEERLAASERNKQSDAAHSTRGTMLRDTALDRDAESKGVIDVPHNGPRPIQPPIRRRDPAVHWDRTNTRVFSMRRGQLERESSMQAAAGGPQNHLRLNLPDSLSVTAGAAQIASQTEAQSLDASTGTGLKAVLTETLLKSTDEDLATLISNLPTLPKKKYLEIVDVYGAPLGDGMPDIFSGEGFRELEASYAHKLDQLTHHSEVAAAGDLRLADEISSRLNEERSDLTDSDNDVPPPRPEYTKIDMQDLDIGQGEAKHSAFMNPDDNSQTLPEAEADSLTHKQTASPHAAQTSAYFPLAPRLVMSIADEEAQPGLPSLTLPPHQAQACIALTRLLDEPIDQVQISQAWQLLMQLPYPHLNYLPPRTINRLFSQLMWTQTRRDAGELTKALQLMEFCDAADVDLDVKQWTSLMVIVGRSKRNITDVEMKAVIDTWTKMEDRGIQADSVVFEVLLLVAIKAERFALADTIMKEMTGRKMSPTRYFRCTMIVRAAVQKNGEAVRAAFADFIHQGDIVDTAVMNLVVMSLIQCGEGDAAELVFTNMKQLHAEKFPIKTGDWKAQKLLAKILQGKASRLRRKAEQHSTSFFGSPFSSKEQLEKIQQITPINPNGTTYAFVIRHHVYTTGNMERVLELLQEMRSQDIPMRGGLFTDLFEGFSLHGGRLASRWSPAYLEMLWQEFTDRAASQPVLARSSDNDFGSVLDKVFTGNMPSNWDEDHDALRSVEDRDLYLGPALVKAVLAAFAKCCSEERLLEVWCDIKSNLSHDLTGPEWDRVNDIVNRMKRPWDV